MECIPWTYGTLHGVPGNYHGKLFKEMNTLSKTITLILLVSIFPGECLLPILLVPIFPGECLLPILLVPIFPGECLLPILLVPIFSVVGERAPKHQNSITISNKKNYQRWCLAGIYFWKFSMFIWVKCIQKQRKYPKKKTVNFVCGLHTKWIPK